MAITAELQTINLHVVVVRRFVGIHPEKVHVVCEATTTPSPIGAVVLVYPEFSAGIPEVRSMFDITVTPCGIFKESNDGQGY